MNVPNILTVLRIVLTFVFVCFYARNTVGDSVVAMIVFTIASLTDYFDGYLARKHNLISVFGKIMDPIADKFLVLSAFYLAVKLSMIAFWMFVVIAAREILVTGLRFYAMSKGRPLAAESAGKLKTVLQIVSIYFIMFLTIFSQLNLDWADYTEFFNGFYRAVNGLVIVVVLVTVWSGYTFIRNNRKAIFRV